MNHFDQASSTNARFRLACFSSGNDCMISNMRGNIVTRKYPTEAAQNEGFRSLFLHRLTMNQIAAIGKVTIAYTFQGHQHIFLI